MRWGIFLTAFFFTLPSFSQSEEYSIDPSSFAKSYFRFLLLKEINAIRAQHRAKELHYDTLLEGGATEHALYLAKNPGAGSFQKGDGRRSTTDKRIKRRGGEFSRVGEVGENTTVQEPVREFTKIVDYYYVNSTYEQLVRNIVSNWMKAKPSHDVLLNDQFQYAGIGVLIDTAAYNVVVVQTLGEGRGNSAALSPSPPSENLKLLLPSAASPCTFGFRTPVNNRNLRKAQRWSHALGKNQPVAHYLTTRYRTARRNFNRWHRRTGLVLEIDSVSPMTERQFHALPSRVDQRNLYKNTAVRFVKGRELMKTARETYWSMYKKERVRIFGIKTPFVKCPDQFIYPVAALGPFDNMLVIRKKKLCDIIVKAPYPFASFTPDPVLIPYQSLSGDFFGKEKKVLLTDTVTQRFFYARNEVQPDAEDLDDVLSRIPADRLVREIRLEAHASIEGTQSANQQLYNRRGEVVKSFLQDNKVATPDLRLVVEASENWEMFYEQIKNSSYSDLALKDQASVRTFINLHKDDSVIQRWLDEQRYSTVFLVLNRAQTVVINADTLAGRFNALARASTKVLTNPKQLTLYRTQWSFYDRISREGHPERWRELIIPADPLRASLRFNEVMFRWTSRELSETDFFAALQKLGQEHTVMVPLYPRLLFNNAGWILNHYFYYTDLANTVPPAVFSNVPQRSELLYFKKYKGRKPKPDERPMDIIMLDYLPQVISDLNRFGERNGVQHKLREYYLVKSINAYQQWSPTKFTSVIRNFRLDLWNNHVTKDVLTDDDRIRWTLYFNQFYDFSRAAWLLSPMVNRPQPHHAALMLWISLLSHQQNRETVRDAVLKAHAVLTREEWIQLVTSGTFISRDFLEDYRIRKMLQHP